MGTETEFMGADNGTEMMQGQGFLATESMENPAAGAIQAQVSPQSMSNFTGGLLQVDDVIEDWKIKSKLPINSGEAEVYRATDKDGNEGIVKYYRVVTNPKTLDILNKIKGLNHKDIINLFSFGKHNGQLYEIMEYAKGGALDSRNEDGTYKYLPLSEDEVLGICEEMINAFKKCHDIGIVHRDIKPGNIYYRKCSDEPDKNGRYKGEDIVIADFGISSILESSEQSKKTRTANRTSAYAAPEILYEEINYKFDYFSLGVTLWELAMGKEPYIRDNGMRLDPALIMQLSFEGMAADNLLRTKPFLSQKLQHLIRGLLVVNPDHRWGYDQVKDHLAGKEVEVRTEQKDFKYNIGNKSCKNLTELAEAILKNPHDAKKEIYGGKLKTVLESQFPEKSKRIEEIAEEASANNDHDNGICKVAWMLSINVPFEPGNNYEIRGVEDIIFLIANAPETMLPQLRDKKSRLYVYLEALDEKAKADEIKALSDELSSALLLSKALVILKGRVIKPYELARYKSFILDTPENLANQEIPQDLQDRILNLVTEKSCEGLIYPWIDLHLKERGVKEYSPKTWNELIDLFSIKAT